MAVREIPRTLADAITTLREAGVDRAFFENTTTEVVVSLDGVVHLISTPCFRGIMTAHPDGPEELSLATINALPLVTEAPTHPEPPAGDVEHAILRGACITCFASKATVRITADHSSPCGRAIAALLMTDRLADLLETSYDLTSSEGREDARRLPTHLILATQTARDCQDLGIEPIHSILCRQIALLEAVVAAPDAPFRRLTADRVAAALCAPRPPFALDSTPVVWATLDAHFSFPYNDELTSEVLDAFCLPRDDDFQLLVAPRFVADYLQLRVEPQDIGQPFVTATLPSDATPALIETINALWNPDSGMVSLVDAIDAARAVLVPAG